MKIKKIQSRQESGSGSGEECSGQKKKQAQRVRGKQQQNLGCFKHQKVGEPWPEEGEPEKEKSMLFAFGEALGTYSKTLDCIGVIGSKFPTEP